MADQPPAEFTVDEPLLRVLLATQYAEVDPDAAAMPLTRAAEGWDCAIWRLGDDLAVRLPQRAVAAALVTNEQQWLPSLAPRVEATGVQVPSPRFAGRPDAGYPWPWSVVPWIPGEAGLAVPRAERTGWATALARALGALHHEAGPGYPVNPYRGASLATRAESIGARFSRLQRTGDARIEVLEATWDAGVTAPVWSGPPVWIHGDLHPGNLVAEGGRLAALIDFGDLTGGDPAYDLAIAWLAFDEAGRRAFVAATGERYDAATWTRARAWAAAMTVILLDTSDDNPAYARLAAEARDELIRP